MGRKAKPKPELGTVEAILLCLHPATKRLMTVSRHRRQATLTCRPDKAVAELRAGKHCHLEAFPGYLEQVEACFAPPRPVAEAIADAEQGDPDKIARGRAWRGEVPYG